MQQYILASIQHIFAKKTMNGLNSLYSPGQKPFLDSGLDKYEPVSSLPFSSKIIEKVVSLQPEKIFDEKSYVGLGMQLKLY